MKRLFDILASSIALFILMPVLVIIAFCVLLGSRGGAFYKQVRIGRHEKPFSLYKFRSMRPDSDKGSQITIGARDPRITGIGAFLRKYKLDELPQLWNILRGDMSIVGPRPEVPKYVAYYTPQQKKVLSVRPGLTDFASLEYLDEAMILGQRDDPEKAYMEEILPAKLDLGLKYVEQQSFVLDLRLIFRTIFKIFKN